MLDRLFDFLREFITLFRFAVVVDVFEQGVILRFGRLHKVLVEPGFYWLIPFGVDRPITENAALEARNLPAQSLTLRCGTSVLAAPVISYRMADPVKFIVEVDDADSAITDVARGTIREVLCQMTWDEITATDSPVLDQMTKAVRKEARRFGIEVTRVTLADLAKVRVLRLVTGE